MYGIDTCRVYMRYAAVLSAVYGISAASRVWDTRVAVYTWDTCPVWEINYDLNELTFGNELRVIGLIK